MNRKAGHASLAARGPSLDLAFQARLRLLQPLAVGVGRKELVCRHAEHDVLAGCVSALEMIVPLGRGVAMLRMWHCLLVGSVIREETLRPKAIRTPIRVPSSTDGRRESDRGAIFHRNGAYLFDATSTVTRLTK